MAELIHRKLSESIIGAAIMALNVLGLGLDEKLYEHARVIEPRKPGHRVDQQKEYKIYYEDQLIGTLVPDLTVDNLVIVDPQMAMAFHETHLAQMLRHLNFTGLQLALLLNFKNVALEWKRVVR